MHERKCALFVHGNPPAVKLALRVPMKKIRLVSFFVLCIAVCACSRNKIDYENYALSKLPRGVFVSFCPDRTSVRFSWLTDCMETNGVLQVLSNSLIGGNQMFNNRVVDSYNSFGSLSGDGKSYIHHVLVTNMCGGVTYPYRLGTEGFWHYGEFSANKEESDLIVVNLNDAQISELSKF